MHDFADKFFVLKGFCFKIFLNVVTELEIRLVQLIGEWQGPLSKWAWEILQLSLCDYCKIKLLILVNHNWSFYKVQLQWNKLNMPVNHYLRKNLWTDALHKLTVGTYFHWILFLDFFCIRLIPSNTLVISYILLFWTSRYSDARFKSKTWNKWPVSEVINNDKPCHNYFLRCVVKSYFCVNLSLPLI